MEKAKDFHSLKEKPEYSMLCKKKKKRNRLGSIIALSKKKIH